MIATANGSANGHGGKELLQRLADLEETYWTSRKEREAQSSYAAGESSRMNPVPRGIDPLGTDADYHYSTERNYFLMVERGRAAVRNHPLVEQGINRLIANLRLDDFALDVNSGDAKLDADRKAFWREWCCDKRRCDYEQARTFQSKARQSFFNEVTDGDIGHVPLVDGSLQTFESHHIRSPYGHRPTGNDRNGIVHGAEVVNGRTVAYHVTPLALASYQKLRRRADSRRYRVFAEDGSQIFFYLGFTHRFSQRRGISRLSPPRDAMTGFDDLNYAHIKSALRRALISFLMESTSPNTDAIPGGNVPQTGPRYTQTSNSTSSGVITEIIEQLGEPAMVLRPPKGYKLQGWNANLPGEGFFDHAAMMLNMLAVNLDLPLMFLLMDGSLVNFHGGRMIWDQMKLRMRQLQRDQIEGLWNPTYQWQNRLLTTPGSPYYDPAMAAAVERGANLNAFRFRPQGWPYVKPSEDVQAEDKAEARNLKSMRSILHERGVDEDEHYPEVTGGRRKLLFQAYVDAKGLQDDIAKLGVDSSNDIDALARELAYGAPIANVSATSFEDLGEGSSARDDADDTRKQEPKK